MRLATVEATPNIAVVKYWGKRDEELMLPNNGSLSFTMDETLKTRTTLAFSPEFKEDEAWINGEKLDEKALKKVIKALDAVREAAGTSEKAKLVSINGFPTAAGMASSASGMAALACAANEVLGLGLDSKGLSILARRGSGSACRSVLGGFVEWRRGEKEDGSDSYAIQVTDENHWPEIRNVIAVVDHGEKKVSSRAGMKQTIETSPLYSARQQYLPKVIEDVKAAVLAKDFNKFGELVMRESNDLHSVMLDTWPPILYLNDVSKEIIYAVHEYNENAGKIVAAYTFDAGPNAHVYTTEDQVKGIKEMLSKIKGIQKTVVCKVGAGPKKLSDGHLIAEDGSVKKHHYDAEKNGIVVE
ncbi:diphosphomevalonate decarboxylase [Candidatus Micrarchaeota archaeon CG10_big_fil_rev_8_21_14_0_10_54_18]|nr:MAG: diphosphomevalonate decarboxylase [Candidatus Micrarchaeota archaeon CG09_land_8_20_14_0_10_55_25]PJD01166.1 MAG: diphosphomevalonate decarboxylase [Candidatus Micrarchaeota archaeon CG10_big_fil_rev_8_21_14_0_10_54_18]